MWEALPGGRRPPKSRLALLLLTPLRTGRVHIAPGPTGKAHETAAVHLHAQAPLAVGAVEGAERPQHMATFADDGAAGNEVSLGQCQILTVCLCASNHALASSRRVPRSGRKSSSSLPISPWRFLAMVISTARAGGRD